MDILDSDLPLAGGSGPRALGDGRDDAAREAQLASPLAALVDAAARPLAELRCHRVWRLAAEPAALRALMEHHAFCVWDFMSLVKALQARLTCVTVPWVPSGSPEVRRFVNEIVLDEESDEVDGAVASHFELYLRAMNEMGADTGPVCAFVADVAAGAAPLAAMVRAGAPAAAVRFVAQTLAVIERGRSWEIAASFTVGREEAIPLMFTELVRALPARGRDDDGRPYDPRALRLYLERHVDVDGGKHAPLARRMVAELCGDDAQRWGEACASALAALAARRALWDAVAEAIAGSSPVLAWRTPPG